MGVTRNLIDRAKTFEDQANIQQEFSLAIQGFEAGLLEHQNHLAEYSRILKTKAFDRYHFHIWEIGTSFPLVTSGCFFPEFSFSGDALQNLDAQIGNLSLLSFNIFHMKNRCFVLFGWLNDVNSSNNRFIKSLSKINISMICDVLIRFCFEISDNIFVNPSWWQNRTILQKRDLLQRLRDNTPGGHSPDGLILGKLRYLDEQIPATMLR